MITRVSKFTITKVIAEGTKDQNAIDTVD